MATQYHPRPQASDPLRGRPPAAVRPQPSSGDWSVLHPPTATPQPEPSEGTQENTLYVPLHDFFGGRPPEDDPVLGPWRGEDADPSQQETTVLRRVEPAGHSAPAEPRVAGPTGPTESGGETRGLVRSSAVMAAGTMVSRVLGMVRTALIAAVFGTSLAGDAFQIANTLPNYVYILLSAGVLNAVLVPQITKALKREDGGKDFVDRLVTAAVGAVVVVAILATLAAPLLVKLTSDLPPDTQGVAIFFAYLCLPQIAFYGLYTVLGQVLNARGQFAAFMWAPALANIVQITGLVWVLVAWGKAGQLAAPPATLLWIVGVSSTLGIAVQGLSLVYPLIKGGFRWTPRFDLRGHGLGQASKILGWTFAALVIAQIGGFIVQRIMTAIRGNDLNVPSVLARDQAFQIFMLPHSFVTVSILTALYPAFSRAFQDGDDNRMRQLMTRSLTMPAVAVIPMSAAMIALSYPIVRVLLPGSGTNHAAVAWILSAMALGTMAFGVTTLQQRFCFAREDGRTNLWLQALLTGVQIAIAFTAFLVPKEWAVFTIALGQTIANTVAAIAFVLVARKQMGGYDLRPVINVYVKVGLCSLLAALAGGVVVWALGLVGGGLVVALLQLMIGGGLFLVVAWFTLRRAGIPEVDELLAPVLRRFGRA